MPIRISRIPRLALYGVSLLLALVSGAVCANAGENLTAGSVVKYTGGIVTSMLIHEGSHALVAGLTGTHLTWEAGNYNQPIAFTDHANTNSKAVAIYSAGLISQTATAEIILDADGINKNDAFVRGMMTWSLLNPILYSLDYWVFHITNKKNGNHFQGDLTSMEHHSSASLANALAASTTALALFQGYRFIKTQDWAPDWLKSNFDNVRLTPIRSGGFMFTFKYDF